MAMCFDGNMRFTRMVAAGKWMKGAYLPLRIPPEQDDWTRGSVSDTAFPEASSHPTSSIPHSSLSSQKTCFRRAFHAQSLGPWKDRSGWDWNRIWHLQIDWSPVNSNRQKYDLLSQNPFPVKIIALLQFVRLTRQILLIHPFHSFSLV